MHAGNFNVYLHVHHICSHMMARSHSYTSYRSRLHRDHSVSGSVTAERGWGEVEEELNNGSAVSGLWERISAGADESGAPLHSLIPLLFSCASYQHFLPTPTISPHSWALQSLFTAHQGKREAKSVTSPLHTLMNFWLNMKHWTYLEKWF